MEDGLVTEQHRTPESAIERALRQAREFAGSFARTAALAMLLLPIILAGVLTADLPFHAFDRFFGAGLAARPSNWLSLGLFFMAVAPFATILMARKYGGEEASTAITAAWGVAAVAVFAELSILAPSIVAGDLPTVRFVVAFVASAMAAQYVAAAVYDVARGAMQWWRAPFYAGLGAAMAFVVVYFPALYAGTKAPWLNWAIGDLLIKTLIAAAFLPVYGVLRRALRPKGGFGGF